MQRLIFRWFFAAIVMIGLGCGTAYQRKGFSGGYSDVRLDDNTFSVAFTGNGYTPRQTVETYLLYRCAELTDKAGFDYFIILGGDTEARHGSYTSPGTYQANTALAGTMATTTGTYTPGQTFYFTKYGATATVKTFHGDKPLNTPTAFNAREVMHYLRVQYPGVFGP